MKSVRLPFLRQSSSFAIDTSLVKKELSENPVVHLEKRGLLESLSDERIIQFASEKKLKLYCGADPTAQSLHLGNLLPLFVLLHFNIRGHDVVGLVGGATGQVGDPSGRLTERSQMDQEVRISNTTRIKEQMGEFLSNARSYFSKFTPPRQSEISVANNHEWWKDVGLLDFLATIGPHVRVNAMLGRESVKARLTSELGIGLNEFTYQILQAYDFYHLHKNKGVSIQVGGNDQWGNITAGIDLINRLKGGDVFGITVPLLTTASGQKFGKSMGNAVFIDKDITPSFEMYNYFMRSHDSEVEKLLKIFTFIPLEQIELILEAHAKDPSLRLAQRILASEITCLIHGSEETQSAATIASILYPLPDMPYPDVATEEVLQTFDKAGLLKKLPKDAVLDKKFSEVLAAVQGCSKGEARKTVKNGGLYYGYNRDKVDPSDSLLVSEGLLNDGRLLILRVGKSRYHVVEVV